MRLGERGAAAGLGAQAADRSAEKNVDGLPADARDVFWHNSLFGGLAGGLSGAPLLSGDVGTPLPAGTLAAASRFASGLAAAAEATGTDELRVLDEIAEAPGKVPLRVLGRLGQRGMAVWLHDQRSTWAAKEEPGEITGAELRVPGLIEGNYTLVWLDTWRGTVIAAATHTAPGKHVDKPLEPTVLRVPPFKRDIGLVVTRQAR